MSSGKLSCHCGACTNWSAMALGIGLVDDDGLVHRRMQCTPLREEKVFAGHNIKLDEMQTGAPAVAAMDKVARQQLRMLVNAKVPTHLLGAEIAKVEASASELYIDVTLAGAKDPVRIPVRLLWEAGLTVAKAVALYGGTIPPDLNLISPHPLLP